MRNIRIRVIESCSRRLCWFDICDGKKELMTTMRSWERKHAAIRNAKAMATCIGIPYDSEIIKLHGC